MAKIVIAYEVKNLKQIVALLLLLPLLLFYYLLRYALVGVGEV